MLNVEAPKINRELYRRYQRGGLSKEELANFCYSLAQTTLNEELARREAEAQKKMEKFILMKFFLIMLSSAPLKALSVLSPIKPSALTPSAFCKFIIAVGCPCTTASSKTISANLSGNRFILGFNQ